MLFVRLMGFRDSESDQVVVFKERLLKCAAEVPEFMEIGLDDVVFDHLMSVRPSLPLIGVASHKSVILGGLAFGENKPQYLVDFAEVLVSNMKEDFDTKDTLLSVCTQAGQCLIAEMNAALDESVQA